MSYFIKDIPVSKNNDYHILQNFKFDRSHPDSVNMRNRIDEIPFANMSMIPESIHILNILSKPTFPRTFVEFHNGFLNEEDDISVTFRWNQPEFTDEVIQGYTVQCWFIENQKEIQICDDKSISATILECTVHNLKPNTTYYFQVQAHTKVGAGPYTNLINVSTTHENPIPQLLIVSDNGIDIWDLDSNTNISLVEDRYVISAAYSIAEHKIYWSNVERKLMMLEMNENNYTMKNITEITKLQNVARNLCIDWIARNLYWMESDYISGFGDIVKLDLTMWENGIVIFIDEDSPLIVLELMEIGDLLQYLRHSRKLQPSDLHVLRLQDLFAMCEDVARGCCYLENLHFVHRDLAARNCLVSARDRENRVIKIGDFGLTRDISKNKYHRSEERYELPICWMAPESLLVDGIFTSQSDVWSFGILMWEITSLGEHPYTGMTFVEVIDYVHAGGRLPMPLNCPPTLYELMSRCWNPADDRPNFKLCLENIIALRNNIEDTFLNPVDI